MLTPFLCGRCVLCGQQLDETAANMQYVRLSLKFLAALLALIFLFASLVAAQQKESQSHSQQPSNESAEQETTVYTCSMHPQIRLPNPGKCPICGMDLIPVKKSTGRNGKEAESLRELTLSPYAEELAQVQTATVERKFVQAEVRMVGFVTYDETKVADITAWVPGRIDRLFVDFTGAVVKKGDPMVYLYSPQLLSAQQELLQSLEAVRRLKGSKIATIQETAQATVTAAKEKLRLWGLTPGQIEDIIKRGKPTDHITIMAPMSGVVIRKNGLEGMYVQTGTKIYTIADLSRVWIQLDAYESDLPWIRLGQKVKFGTGAHPGTVFEGDVAFIDPFLKEKTRTVQVRLNAANPNNTLKPDMFVHATLLSTLAAGDKVVVNPTGNEKPPLVIPASAPLITGIRAVVYVAVPDQPGTYEGRVIVLGPKVGDYYVVRYGLKEGEKVVTDGNFMIDSSLQIEAKPSMMTPQGGATGMMHAHAGQTATASKAQPPGMQVPTQFKVQFKPVLAAYENLGKVLGTQDLEKVRREFENFRKTLAAIDAESLSGHPRMLWLELDMLLESDAVVGREAANMKETTRAFGELTKDFTRLKTEFGLGEKIPETKPINAPQAFKAEIGEMLNAYLAVKDALANDQFNRAQDSMRSFEDVINAVDTKLLPADVREKWSEFFSNFQVAIAETDQAKNLETFRQCFAVVSEAMAMAVKTFDIYPPHVVYLIHCPMAFENRGANWLQKEKEVQNPYFGQAMLGCGEINETYFENAPAGQGGQKHE